MTRRDMASPSGDREALKQEIRSEIRSEGLRKSMRGCFGCLIIVVLAVGIPTTYAAVIAAKSGYARVPLLSGMYRDPAPLREVLPLAGTTAEDLKQTLPLKSRFDPLTSMGRLPITEVELTTLAQDAAAKAPPGMLPFPVKRVQFVVEPNFVEMFVVTPRDGRDVSMRFRFKPRVVDGAVKVDVVEAVSGSYVVPHKFANFMFEVLFTGGVAAVQTQLSTLGSIRSFDLATKTLTPVIQVRN